MEQITGLELEHLAKKVDEIQTDFGNFTSGFERAGFKKQADEVIKALDTLYEELDDKTDEVREAEWWG